MTQTRQSGKPPTATHVMALLEQLQALGFAYEVRWLPAHGPGSLHTFELRATRSGPLMRFTAREAHTWASGVLHGINVTTNKRQEAHR